MLVLQVQRQLGHGLKSAAAVARHGDTHAHVLEIVVLPALAAYQDIRKAHDLAVTHQAVAGILEQVRVHAQIGLYYLARVSLLH